MTTTTCPVTAELRQVQDSIHPDVPARDVLLADVKRRREERRLLIEQFAQPTLHTLDPFDQFVEELR